MESTKEKFTTSVVNLEDLQNFSFSVPTYQRPYVWVDEQIEKLLGDLYKTFEKDPNENYYLGTILTKEDGNKAELIDGQQRFTTLWLTAFVFSQKLNNSKIGQFLRNEDRSLKINFEIRSEVEEYFKSLLELKNGVTESGPSEETIKSFHYLTNIASGLTTIRNIINPIPNEKLESFAEYIYSRVVLIKNTTPSKIDLNKLFSTINSAGVQLEQTDIIKANLLNAIKDDKVLFSKIWETCENTNNFFERNVRESFPETKWANVDLSKYLDFNEIIFKYNESTILGSESAEGNEPFNISDFKLSEVALYEEGQRTPETEKRDSEEVFCRSIINFGQLLLHTYRLHLKQENLPDFEGTFHVNRIIKIFKPLIESGDSERIKRFFLLLWKVRFLFDLYVIKWVSDINSKDEGLELININRSTDGYYPRSKYERSSMLMLQSVLYFTGDYLRQFWLTSYLGYLLDHHQDLSGNNDIHLARLEKIDNSLSLCKTMTDKEASLVLIDSEVDTNYDYVEYLSLSEGTKFQRYWFYKLEYILWKNWENRNDEKFKNYRITSKNSIEHIYPQNLKSNYIADEAIKPVIDNFGNLVLLSVSQNSEYSNKAKDVKRSDFKTKNVYDSLKSYHIFRPDLEPWEWSIEQVNGHQKNMIDLLILHYNK